METTFYAIPDNLRMALIKALERRPAGDVFEMLLGLKTAPPINVTPPPDQT